jgi:hypothetical protein
VLFQSRCDGVLSEVSKATEPPVLEARLVLNRLGNGLPRIARGLRVDEPKMNAPQKRLQLLIDRFGGVLRAYRCADEGLAQLKLPAME